MVVGTDKESEVTSLNEITVESRLIRLLRGERQESSRIHSTPEGLRAIMDAIKG